MNNLLKSLRALKGYNQQYLADVLGINKSVYCLKETGKREFKMIEMKKISELFGKTVDELFFTS